MGRGEKGGEIICGGGGTTIMGDLWWCGDDVALGASAGANRILDDLPRALTDCPLSKAKPHWSQLWEHELSLGALPNTSRATCV